jgi:putative acetyltransferase
MVSLRVRRATDAGAATAAAEIDAVVAPEGTLGVEPPVDVARRAANYSLVARGNDDGGLWLLEIDGAVAGYATLHEHRRGVLSLGMALLPAARGRGGGRALLDALIEHGRGSAAHKLDLEVWVDNARAIAVYIAAGFTVEGIRRDHYLRRDGRLRTSMLMGLPLA